MSNPSMPQQPRRRFKATDIETYLDMNAIGQIFLAVSVTGYIRLLDAVWTQQSGSFKAVSDALEARQTTDELRQAAHSLKSEAGSLGLKALFELARDIEHQGGSYSDEACAAAATELKACWATSLALCERMGFRL